MPQRVTDRAVPSRSRRSGIPPRLDPLVGLPALMDLRLAGCSSLPSLPTQAHLATREDVAEYQERLKASMT